MSLTGVDAVKKRLAELFAKAPGAVASAMYQEGLAVDAAALRKMPVDSGRMRASHYVSPPEKAGDTVVVEIGVGTEYAVFVHEDTSKHHPVGGAKFLERALNERASGFAERLAKRAAANLKAGVVTPLLSAPSAPQDVGVVGKMLGPTRNTLRKQTAKVRRAVRRAKKAERQKVATKKAAEKAAEKKLKQALKKGRREDAERDAASELGLGHRKR